MLPRKFFDIEYCFCLLIENVNTLVALRKYESFEAFLSALRKTLDLRGPNIKVKQSPYVSLSIFKSLIWNNFYAFLNDCTDFQSSKRLSSMRFLAFNLRGRVSSPKTLRICLEPLKKLIYELFHLFNIKSEAYLTIEGQRTSPTMCGEVYKYPHKTDGEYGFIKDNALTSEIHRKSLNSKSLPAHITRDNTNHYKGYGWVRHLFSLQKYKMGEIFARVFPIKYGASSFMKRDRKSAQSSCVQSHSKSNKIAPYICWMYHLKPLFFSKKSKSTSFSTNHLVFLFYLQIAPLFNVVQLEVEKIRLKFYQIFTNKEIISGMHVC